MGVLPVFLTIYIYMAFDIKNYNKKYYQANKEKVIERSKAHYEANKDDVLAKGKEWREVNREVKKQSDKSYYLKNKEKHLATSKKYYEDNKERLQHLQKEYSKVNKEVARKASQKWRESNPKYGWKHKQARVSIDPAYKMIEAIRTRHRDIIKGRLRTAEGLGCDQNFLKQYLENQFTEGMSWDNHGNKEGQWSIDHIKPLSLYYDSPELLPELIHYTNLQPMWHLDNMKKGKKL